MATRKQKHLIAVAKREAFMAEEKERGLALLAEDRKSREAKEANDEEVKVRRKRPIKRAAAQA